MSGAVIPSEALRLAGRSERQATVSLDVDDAITAILLRVLAATWNAPEADDIPAGPDIVR